MSKPLLAITIIEHNGSMRSIVDSSRLRGDVGMLALAHAVAAAWRICDEIEHLDPGAEGLRDEVMALAEEINDRMEHTGGSLMVRELGKDSK